MEYQDACIKLAEWIAYYNSERLHSAIWYLTPNDVFYGRAAGRLEERKEKLHLRLLRDRNTGGHKMPVPDMPWSGTRFLPP